MHEPLSDRIHNAIKQALAGGRYHVVDYKQGMRYTLRELAKPQTVLVRSLTSAFEPNRSSLCGADKRQRTGWIWTADVHFDRQVSLDLFEQGMQETDIVLPREGELTQQITIFLLDATHIHPPETQSSHGTRVTYRFQADLSPN